MLLPVARRQLLLGADRRRDRTVRRAAIRAFAVDTDGRGDEHLLHLVLAVDENVEQQRRASRVDVHVAIDLVHALADADRRAEMDDGLRGEHERLEHQPIPDVTFDVLRLRVGVAGPGAGAMHLRLEVVEHGHAVVARDERIDEVRTDVPGAAGDENVVDAHG